MRPKMISDFSKEAGAQTGGRVSTFRTIVELQTRFPLRR